MLYRKKPIIVEANQWFPALQETGKPRIPERHGVRYCPPNKVDLSATRGIIVDRPAQYIIDTLEGPMQVQPGDWIVMGVKGEKYAVKPDIFALTYEPALPDLSKLHGISWWRKWWRKHDPQISRTD